MLLNGNDAVPGDEPDIDSKAKSLAARCWTEDEEFLAKEKIAEWLGGRWVGSCAWIPGHKLNFCEVLVSTTLLWGIIYRTLTSLDCGWIWRSDDFVRNYF